MSYTRRNTEDGVTVMNKDLYDNLQDGIEERGVTPEMFGAKGDGITDDSSSFQRMVDYAVENLCLIIIPNKVYKLVTPISVKSEDVIKIRGCLGKKYITGNNKSLIICSDSFIVGNGEILYLQLEDLGLMNMSNVNKPILNNVVLRNSVIKNCGTRGFAGFLLGVLERKTIVTENWFMNLNEYFIKPNKGHSVFVDSDVTFNYINGNPTVPNTTMVMGGGSHSNFQNNFCDFWTYYFAGDIWTRTLNISFNHFDYGYQFVKKGKSPYSNGLFYNIFTNFNSSIKGASEGFLNDVETVDSDFGIIQGFAQDFSMIGNQFYGCNKVLYVDSATRTGFIFKDNLVEENDIVYFTNTPLVIEKEFNNENVRKTYIEPLMSKKISELKSSGSYTNKFINGQICYYNNKPYRVAPYRSSNGSLYVGLFDYDGNMASTDVPK